MKERVAGLKKRDYKQQPRKDQCGAGQKMQNSVGQRLYYRHPCGLKFHISLSFYQVNRAQAERLYTIAAEYAGLTGSETLLDLYFQEPVQSVFPWRKNAKRVIGVEVVEQAVEDARKTRI